MLQTEKKNTIRTVPCFQRCVVNSNFLVVEVDTFIFVLVCLLTQVFFSLSFLTPPHYLFQRDFFSLHFSSYYTKRSKIMSSPVKSSTASMDKLIQRDLHSRACVMPTAFQVIPREAVINNDGGVMSEEAEKAAISQLRERFSAVKPTAEHASKALDMLRAAKNGY